MRYLLSVVVVVLCAGVLSAATINVPADQPTIQASIDVASEGDTVASVSPERISTVSLGNASTTSVSPGMKIGDTYYDMQHYGSMPRMLQWDTGGNHLYFVWTGLAMPANAVSCEVT